MNKSDLITALATGAGTTKAIAGAVVDNLGALAGATLAAGGEVTLPGIGSLKPVKRAAREGRNPLTGEKLKIPAKTVAKFTAAKALKDALAAPAGKKAKKAK